MCMQSLIDDKQLESIQKVAAKCKQQVAAGQFAAAERSFLNVTSLLFSYNGGADFYNFRVFHKPENVTDKRTLLEKGEFRVVYDISE